MQDMKASAEKLRAEANYAEQIARSDGLAEARALPAPRRPFQTTG